MIGGIFVDIESIKNNDTLQLQQMIVFLKSELAKYQNEISALKNNDYSSLVSHLEQENSQLSKQNKDLSIELLKLRKTYEKEMNDLHEDIQSRETQRIKLVSTIEALVKNKKDLQTENTKLMKTIEQVHNSNVNSPKQLEKYFKKSIENIDRTLQDIIQKNSQQFSTIIEELVKNKNEVIDINLYLLQELKSKNNKIDLLMGEIDKLKEQLHKESISPVVAENTTINSNILSHLDTQVQKMLTQSVNFETQLDEKLRILDDLEYKLIQLANDINHKKTSNKQL